MNIEQLNDSDLVGFNPLDTKQERSEECVFKKCCKKYKKKGKHCKKCPQI